MGKTPTQVRRLGVYNLVFEFFFLNIFVGFFFGFTRSTTSQVNLIGLTSLFRLTAFLVMGFLEPIKALDQLVGSDLIIMVERMVISVFF